MEGDLVTLTRDPHAGAINGSRAQRDGPRAPAGRVVIDGARAALHHREETEVRHRDVQVVGVGGEGAGLGVGRRRAGPGGGHGEVVGRGAAVGAGRHQHHAVVPGVVERQRHVGALELASVVDDPGEGFTFGVARVKSNTLLHQDAAIGRGVGHRRRDGLGRRGLDPRPRLRVPAGHEPVDHGATVNENASSSAVGLPDTSVMPPAGTTTRTVSPGTSGSAGVKFTTFSCT